MRHKQGTHKTVGRQKQMVVNGQNIVKYIVQSNEHEQHPMSVTTMCSCFHGKTIRKQCQCKRNVGRHKHVFRACTCKQLTMQLTMQKGAGQSMICHFRMTTFTCKLALATKCASLHSPSFKEGLTKEIVWARLLGDSKLPKPYDFGFNSTRQFQMSSFQIRRASSMSTRLCGGEFRELCFDFKPHNCWLAASLLCLHIITLAANSRW